MREPDAPPIFVNGIEIDERVITREAQNHPAPSVEGSRVAAARAWALGAARYVAKLAREGD